MYSIYFSEGNTLISRCFSLNISRAPWVGSLRLEETTEILASIALESGKFTKKVYLPQQRYFLLTKQLQLQKSNILKKKFSSYPYPKSRIMFYLFLRYEVYFSRKITKFTKSVYKARYVPVMELMVWFGHTCYNKRCIARLGNQAPYFDI